MRFLFNLSLWCPIFLVGVAIGYLILESVIEDTGETYIITLIANAVLFVLFDRVFLIVDERESNVSTHNKP